MVTKEIQVFCAGCGMDGHLSEIYDDTDALVITEVEDGCWCFGRASTIPVPLCSECQIPQ